MVEDFPGSVDYAVTIIGAGPVGLLAANLLGLAGLKVLVVERLQEPVPWSRAIGVSPPSLSILAHAGLDSALIQAGIPIRSVVVHGNGGVESVLGRVSFDSIPSPYPYILSIPQVLTEEILYRGAVALPSVEILRTWELVGMAERSDRIDLKIRMCEGKSDSPVAPYFDTREGPGESSETLTRDISTSFVLGCDGTKSTVRELSGIGVRGSRYPYTFVMGDFEDKPNYGAHAGFGGIAHLFFTKKGAVESFPLPGGLRRWIVQSGEFEKDPGDHFIVDRIRERSGLEIKAEDLRWQSPFGVQRFRAERYFKGRVFLAGDAAHGMSPIGGQGMNTGFADVDALVPLLKRACLQAGRPVYEGEWRTWERRRMKAFKVAANRAWRSMRLGTVRGSRASHIRNAVLWIMLNGPFKSRVPKDYAMLTLPGKKEK